MKQINNFYQSLKKFFFFFLPIGMFFYLSDTVKPLYAGPGQEDEIQKLQNSFFQKQNLFLKAVFSKSDLIIEKGVIWRIFGSFLDEKNHLPLLKFQKGGKAEFYLEPGTYFVYASFGRLTAQKRIHIKENQQYNEIFQFKAGALSLNAQLTEGQIDLSQVTFSIYADNTEDEKASLLSNIKPNEIVRLPEGIYHILSKYGSVNALKREDIQIKTHQLTQATIKHTAAKITLRLVRQKKGEALADTSWAINDRSGDPIWESVGAYATIILEEGNYSVIAKNKDSLYQKNITVASGKDQNIDILVEDYLNENLERQFDEPMD